ncbi:MAG: acyl-CoA dehydrogenase family protein [Euryarchaeota archaeon]|nr:acyl-CoA dehydrogenase family protein [Euryarchaeota archaeon]
MVDFEIPRNIEGLRKTMHTVARNQLRPISRHYDEHENEVPWDLIRKVHSLLKAMGGSGLGRRDPGSRKDSVSGASINTGFGNFMATVITEEMTWGDAGLSICLPGPQVGGAAVAAAGSEEQKQKFLGRFPGDEPTWGAFAITEPGCGSDTSSIRTTARREGNEWVLNGEKIFCTSGGFALEQSKGFVIVWATIDPGAGRAGIKSFIVEAGTPGVRVSKVEKKMGLHASNTVSIVLDDARIPLENILGGMEVLQKEKKGFEGVMATFDSTRPIVASFAVGVGRAALDFTRDYLREQGITIRYGLSPSRLTAVEWDFMKMEEDLHAARLLARRAGWLADMKRPNALEAAMAKVKAGSVVPAITQKCCEIVGPLGVSSKALLEKWFRDAKVNDIYEGTGQINTLIVARRILGYTREQLR